MRGDDTEYVSIGEVTLRRHTGKAVMIKSEDIGVDDLWIPLSCIDWDQSDRNFFNEADGILDGEDGELYVAEWFAKKNGLV